METNIIFLIMITHNSNFRVVFFCGGSDIKMRKIDLGKEKITKLLLMFSIPCVISMLINSIYNIVDQIFIGQ